MSSPTFVAKRGIIKLVVINSPRPPDKRFVAEIDDSLKSFSVTLFVWIDD